jgi:hypothetical protein
MSYRVHYAGGNIVFPERIGHRLNGFRRCQHTCGSQKVIQNEYTTMNYQS